jgi:Flp pilus assembly protein TadD
MQAAVIAIPARGLGRRSIAVLTASLLALSTAACSIKSPADFTASLGSGPSEPTTQEGWRSYTEDWGRRYDADPTSKSTALNYARGLRVLQQHAQAAAVLQQAAIRAPMDTEVLGAYGRALSDAGRLKEADAVLAKAHVPERPDWRLLSVQGAVADQLGEPGRAERYYLAALKINPNEPTVMSNLGLSYALANRLGDAERTLREAARNPSADARVRQNLALVLGLQGKFDEAETIFKRDMPAEEASRNLAYLKQSVSQQNNWSAIKKLERPDRQQAEKTDSEMGNTVDRENVGEPRKRLSAVSDR